MTWAERFSAIETIAISLNGIFMFGVGVYSGASEDWAKGAFFLVFSLICRLEFLEIIRRKDKKQGGGNG